MPTLNDDSLSPVVSPTQPPEPPKRFRRVLLVVILGIACLLLFPLWWREKTEVHYTCQQWTENLYPSYHHYLDVCLAAGHTFVYCDKDAKKKTHHEIPKHHWITHTTKGRRTTSAAQASQDGVCLAPQ